MRCSKGNGIMGCSLHACPSFGVPAPNCSSVFSVVSRSSSEPFCSMFLIPVCDGSWKDRVFFSFTSSSELIESLDCTADRSRHNSQPETHVFVTHRNVTNRAEICAEEGTDRAGGCYCMGRSGYAILLAAESVELGSLLWHTVPQLRPASSLEPAI